jgi:hypothetical protein
VSEHAGVVEKFLPIDLSFRHVPKAYDKELQRAAVINAEQIVQ